MLENDKTRKMSVIALLSAIAIVLNVLENMMALPLGIRIGFANIIAMVVIHLYGIKETIFLNMMRVVVAGLLSGIILSYPWWMSVGGVFLSTIVLILIYKHSSYMFTGIVCAIAHSIGQIVVLSLFLTSKAFIPYLSVMAICSVVSGLFTGRVAEMIVNRIKIRV